MQGILEFLRDTPPATILLLVGVALIILGLVNKIPLGKESAIEVAPASRRISLGIGLLFVTGAIVWLVVQQGSGRPQPTPEPTDAARAEPTVPESPATSTPTTSAVEQPTLGVGASPLPEHTSEGISPSSLARLERLVLLETGFRRLPTALAFSPTSTNLAVGLEDGSIQIWEIGSGQMLLEDPGAHASRVRTLAYSPPEGRFLASGSWDTTAKVWRVVGNVLAVQSVLLAEQREYAIQSVAFSPTGLTLGIGLGDNQLYVFSVSSGALLDQLVMGRIEDYVESLSFSSEGSFVGAGSSDGAVQAWRMRGEGDPASRPEWVNVPEPVSAARSVAFSPIDDSVLVSGHKDGAIRIWNAIEGRISRPTQIQGSVRSMAFSPDGAILAVATEQGIVYLLSAADLSQMRDPLEFIGDVPILAFSPDGTRLAVGSSDGVSLWGISP